MGLIHEGWREDDEGTLCKYCEEKKRSFFRHVATMIHFQSVVEGQESVLSVVVT